MGDHERPKRPSVKVLPTAVRQNASRSGALAVGRQLHAGLKLEESIGRQDLAESDERLEDRDAAAEADALLAGRQHHLADDAEDVSAVEAVEQRVLDRERHVAEAALPSASAVLLQQQRHDDLELAAGAQPLLVEELVADVSRPARATVVVKHGFVLRKRLLGDERARQVQFPARPRGICAEGTRVVEDLLQLRLRQRAAEGGHPAVERAGRPAIVHDSHPVRIRLGRGEAALGEIRDRCVEAHSTGRRAAAVGAMTRGAGRLVQRTASGGLHRGLGFRGRGMRGRADDAHTDDSRQQHRKHSSLADAPAHD